MSVLLLIAILYIASVAAVGLGWAADTRDREYSIGRVLDHRPWEDDTQYPDQSSATRVGEAGTSDDPSR